MERRGLAVLHMIQQHIPTEEFGKYSKSYRSASQTGRKPGKQNVCFQESKGPVGCKSVAWWLLRRKPSAVTGRVLESPMEAARPSVPRVTVPAAGPEVTQELSGPFPGWARPYCFPASTWGSVGRVRRNRSSAALISAPSCPRPWTLSKPTPVHMSQESVQLPHLMQTRCTTGKGVFMAQTSPRGV